MTKISTLVFDFDGVFRHFDPTIAVKAEKEYGLTAGSIMHAAFETYDYSDVATGQVTKSQWIARTGKEIGCDAAAEAVLNDIGSIDQHMVEVLNWARESSFTTALLTNSTCTIHKELTHFGLDNSFDFLFTTNTIGVAKPDSRIFEHVCQQINVAPSEVFFTDDLEDNIAGAVKSGLNAELFESPAKTMRAIENLSRR